MTTPKAGNEPDWSEIFGDHAPALYSRSRRVLGPEPHSSTGVSADDTVQEVFVRAMKNLRYEGSRYEVRSFLQRQLGWVLSEVFKEQGRRRGALEKLGPSDGTGPDPIEDVLDRVDDDQVLKISFEHLGCLTPKERRVWEEYLRKGRPAAEVAAQFGVTPTRIRQLAQAAGRKLLRCVGNPHHA